MNSLACAVFDEDRLRAMGARELEFGFRRDDAGLEDSIYAASPPVVRDWLSLAHKAYLADRAHRRPAGGWQRAMHLEVGVSDPRFWSEHSEELSGCLHWLTGDQWSFQFKPGGPRESREGFLDLSSPEAPMVALFSGGLDSAAGALIELSVRPTSTLVLVSGWTNPQHRARQGEQADILRARFRGRVEHAFLRHGFVDSGNYDFEPTQRSRGFLHLTLGYIVALLRGASELRVFENGVGAINLPVDHSQFGAECSRPVNPITLEKIARLGAKIAQKAGYQPLAGIVNPFVWSTKGQMCERMRQLGGQNLAALTFSCDRPQRRRAGYDHCGACTSCLLRRASLAAGGMPDDPARYVEDVLGPARLDGTLPAAFGRMSRQAEMFKLLLNAGWRAWCVAYPDLPLVEEAMRQRHALHSIVALHRRHVGEWEAFERRCLEPLPAMLSS